MKLKRLAVIAIALSASTFSMAASANDAIVESICSYVAADNKNDLRRTLSDNRVRLKSVYDSLSCNGMTLVRFAMSNNAAGTGEFIVKQLPSSHFEQSGDMDWAKSNGHADSPIIASIQARISGS